MAFDQATYLRDHQDNDTKGLVVVETGDDELRVTENRGGDWCKPFWMPLDELEVLHTEVVGKLPSEKFLAVCEKAGVTPERKA